MILRGGLPLITKRGLCTVNVNEIVRVLKNTEEANQRLKKECDSSIRMALCIGVVGGFVVGKVTKTC